MSLADLIRRGSATATPATPATPAVDSPLPVATVATVAVATLPKLRFATDAEAATLRRLVKIVATFHAFTDEEHAEALEIAMSDPENALTCFRALIQEIPR